ncbi:conserved hypothetical protein [Hyphomicrobiales bacterium]|nr:conserved hypothetical protein [Hyphomicrobiales bacterium]CAH1673569.1 conserved hypothetical protein [Hyphomicrobiales bacterium]
MGSWTTQASTNSPGSACAATVTISATTARSAARDISKNRFPSRWSAAGGYDFAARPRLSAHDQPVFWSETADTAVLRLAGAPGPAREGNAKLRTFLAGKVKATPDELHILLRDIGPGLHLVADPSIQPDDPLAVTVYLDADGLDRLASLDRLMRYLAGYKVPPDQRMTAQQRRRLKAMLRAVDARQHHASQREIAQILFGVDRIADDQWQGSPFRDTVRDLLRDGAVMIAGGYLKLLRFRRRP